MRLIIYGFAEGRYLDIGGLGADTDCNWPIDYRTIGENERTVSYQRLDPAVTHAELTDMIG